MRGIPCVVYERDLGLEGVRRGYGLTLGPTCWAALADLGLEPTVPLTPTLARTRTRTLARTRSRSRTLTLTLTLTLTRTLTLTLTL